MAGLEHIFIYIVIAIFTAIDLSESQRYCFTEGNNLYQSRLITSSIPVYNYGAKVSNLFVIDFLSQSFLSRD